MTTRLHLDWTRCDGHGACAELLPGLLTVDDFGFPVSRSGDKDPGWPGATRTPPGTPYGTVR